MKRGAVGSIVTLALGILVVPVVAGAQPPAKVYRIGLFRAGPLPSSSLEALRQGLRELGCVEGQNMTIECRWVEPEGLSQAVAELVHLKVDVLLAGEIRSYNWPKLEDRRSARPHDPLATPLPCGWGDSMIPLKVAPYRPLILHS
jgi:hypothetical protein